MKNIHGTAVAALLACVFYCGLSNRVAAAQVAAGDNVSSTTPAAPGPKSAESSGQQSSPSGDQTGPDAPATKADIERYLDAMHSHDTMKQMIVQMAKPMHQMVHEQYEKDKDRLPPDFETHLNQAMDQMLNEMPLDEMMQAMVPVYQKHFTKGDIDALIAFYSAPTGQKMLREMPQIMAESMQVIMPIMQKEMTSMTERLQEDINKSLHQSHSSHPVIEN